MTENEKTELFDKWYDKNYDEWAEGEEGIALREELEQAFKGGIAELEKENAELKNKLEHRNCLDCSNHSSKLRMRTLDLEKENADLKRDKEDLIFVRNAKADHIIELKEQIEKMKCCQNCKYDDKDCIEEPCCDCSRILGDIKRKGASDKWEIEEND